MGNEIRNGAGQPVRLRGVNIPSGEYACIQGWVIVSHQVSGVSDAATVQALLSWKINAVRLPLNEDCWLGINRGGSPMQVFGASYRAAITSYVTQLTQDGIAVILDLHWAAPAAVRATYQIPMADRDHATAFWTSVANTFKGNTAVIFDLFNEPYPDNNTDDSIAAWLCLRDGSPPAGPTIHCPGPYFDDQGNPVPSNYSAAGMQELLDAVRATGATKMMLPLYYEIVPNFMLKGVKPFANGARTLWTFTHWTNE